MPSGRAVPLRVDEDVTSWPKRHSGTLLIEEYTNLIVDRDRGSRW
eukprot:COSAG02_NODE_65661_length_257_cov_0.981013_1_plen_44_part_01